jgi:hypothetical protein
MLIPTTSLSQLALLMILFFLNAGNSYHLKGTFNTACRNSDLTMPLNSSLVRSSF